MLHPLSGQARMQKHGLCSPIFQREKGNSLMLFGFLVCFSFVVNLNRVVLIQPMVSSHCSSLSILQLPLKWDRVEEIQSTRGDTDPPSGSNSFISRFFFLSPSCKGTVCLRFPLSSLEHTSKPSPAPSKGWSSPVSCFPR